MISVVVTLPIPGPEMNGFTIVLPRGATIADALEMAKWIRNLQNFTSQQANVNGETTTDFSRQIESFPGASHTIIFQ